MKKYKPFENNLPHPKDFLEALDIKRKKKANKPRRDKCSKQKDLP